MAALVTEMDSQATDLLTNASKLLHDEGPQALTVRKIAASAGWSTMGVYSRFGSKNGVVDALYLEGIERIERDLNGVSRLGNPAAVLRQTIVTYRDTAIAHSSHYQLVFGGVVADFTPTTASRAVTARVFAAFKETVASAVNSGEIAATKTEDLAYSLWALSHGLITLEISAPPGIKKDDFSRRYQVAIDFMITGMARG